MGSKNERRAHEWRTAAHEMRSLPTKPLNPTTADEAQALLVVCERTVAKSGPRPGSRHWVARGVARVTTPLGLAMHGMVVMGATFWGWLAVLLGLLLSQHWVAQLQLIDVKAIEGYSYALIMYFTVAIALASPSHLAKPGYSGKDLSLALSVAENHHLPTSRSRLDFIRHHLDRGEENLRRRITSLRWAAGVLFGLAAYLAQKGIDSGNGNLLSAALLPLLGAGAISLCLSAYQRGAVSVYGLAHAVLHAYGEVVAERAKRSALGRVRVRRQHCDRTL
jgi:hypothetical protein